MAAKISGVKLERGADLRRKGCCCFVRVGERGRKEVRGKRGGEVGEWKGGRERERERERERKKDKRIIKKIYIFLSLDHMPL